MDALIPYLTLQTGPPEERLCLGCGVRFVAPAPHNFLLCYQALVDSEQARWPARQNFAANPQPRYEPEAELEGYAIPDEEYYAPYSGQREREEENRRAVDLARRYRKP